MQDMVGILKNFQNQKILVAGDLMLDRFVYGDVDRISPESPVPVLSITHEDIMLGGAGNVLANLHALGCIAVPFAVVGSDDSAKEIKKILGSFEYNLDGILTDETRPTTIKTRYVARHQQLLRSDLEKTHPISSGIEKDIVKKVTDIIADVKCVVLSDYGKGFLTKSLVAAIISAAKKYKVPVLVDPKGYDYSIYMGADIVTPNRKELSLASGVSNLKLDKDIEGAAKKIISSCGISHVVATRSEDGLSVISKDAPALHLPTKAQEVFDVSGAGGVPLRWRIHQ
jgi:D-beta-D-heptose 7-phosphate kinase / D-beta-D-heptose 1-phosphate adenosyltransferase